ncbi:MAG TPA: hypothetical protein VH593_19655 [Ktedonobacteraceae bacterium]|jgi:hypothetical protein
MTERYNYEITGEAQGGQTWTATGTIYVNNPGQFVDVPDLSMKDAFMKLTSGRAVYGQPGKGCRGPYQITKMLIEKGVNNG